MATRPHDLRARRFRTVLRGASRWEVRELLTAVAADYEATLNEVERLRTELARAGSRLVAAREHDREATRELRAAEAAGHQLRAAAEEQAAALIATAEGRVAGLLGELEAERRRLESRITHCLEQQQRLAAVMQTELDGLQALLAAEPQLPPAADSESPTPIRPDDTAVEAVQQDDSAWSADDVSQALAAATAAAVPLPRVARPPDQVDLPRRNATTRTGIRKRLIPVGLAAGVIVGALAMPGVRPWLMGPVDSADRASGPRRSTRQIVAAAGMSAPVETANRTASPSAPPSTTAPGSANPVPPAAAGTASPRPSAPESPVPAGAFRVRLDAVRPCWIRLTANGRTEERVLKPGESLVRDSATDLVLRAGNAGALVVSINGRPIAPIGREGETVTRRFRPRDAAAP